MGAIQPRHVFLTLFIVSVIYGGTSADYCSNPPPGIPWMVRGVDITKLDVLPLDITRLNGYKSPVLGLTCQRERSWPSGGVRYNIPDQVWTITSTPRGLLPSNVHLYKTTADVRNAMQLAVGGKGNIWKFSFSDSALFKQMQNEIVKMNRFISDASATDPVSRVDLLPPWDLHLNMYAKEYLEKKIGNTTYTENTTAYHSFIDQFGTHYFSVAKFGGSIRVLYETQITYTSYPGRTDEQAKQGTLASFQTVLENLGAKYTDSSTSRSYSRNYRFGAPTQDYSFDSRSTYTIKFYGGTTTHLTSNGIQAWQPTVNSSPWLISGQLQSISDLIQDDTQKTGMEKAVEQHILRRYLVELRRLLEIGKAKFGQAVGGLETRLAAIEGLSVGNLVEADIETLQVSIESVAEVPEWFLENTNLCYLWRADSTNGQCDSSRNSQGSLCEKVGQMTPWYYDNTDDRAGGCRMQWGIFSRNYESWFKEVQICYRWVSDGTASQCSNKASGMVCAPVDSYTTFYRDDTNNSPGGCKMSWRLVVPSAAPKWIRQLMMCFSWYPTGNINQCGPAPSRDICATANEWTPYYRDNTFWLHGGCRMSWGLKFNF